MENVYICENTGRLGLFVPLDHPQVVQPRPAHFIYPKLLARIERDALATEAFLSSVEPFTTDLHIMAVKDERTDDAAPFWSNGYFSGDDARLAYGYVASGLPKLITEVGSGNSTKFMRLAISAYGLTTKILSIDPVPRADIDSLVDEVIRSSVLDVDLAVFDRLEAGDVLFWDGSHIVFNGTDTVRLFLEILPALKPGVVVHIHDICLPGEYIDSFDGRGYSEQYMLAAALLFGDIWEVLAPVCHLCAAGRLGHGGVSFWMRRRDVAGVAPARLVFGRGGTKSSM